MKCWVRNIGEPKPGACWVASPLSWWYLTGCRVFVGRLLVSLRTAYALHLPGYTRGVPPAWLIVALGLTLGVSMNLPDALCRLLRTGAMA